MEKIYDIELRISTAASIAPLFAAVQGDNNTRKIRATILNDDGTAYSPGSGVTAEYWEAKADGTGTQHTSGVTISGNIVTVVLTQQDLAAPGRTNGAIVLKDGSDILAAMPFWFTVVAIPIGSHVASANEYEIMREATQAAIEAARHFPYIDSTTNHWMLWDVTTSAFVDTGVDAKGRNPYIRTTDLHWMVWDTVTETYVDSGIVSEGHSPYISITNEHWMVWDVTTEAYVDSGILSGPKNPYINTSGHWMIWNGTTEAYVDSGIMAEANSPYIDSTTGHWMEWDATTEDYVDTDIMARAQNPYIAQNGHWMVWDSSTETFVDSGVASAAHSPYINNNNQHWMIWDPVNEEYTDSGISATGADGVVMYSITQSLTDAQKTRARENIGAATSTLNDNAVQITNQTFTDAQKAIARENIGAAAGSDVGVLTNLETTAKSSIVAAVNEVNGKVEDLIIADYDPTDGSITFRTSEAATYDSTDGSITINV